MASRGKILLIDDDADIHRLITAMLQSKYLVFTATDGLKGIQKAQQCLPDVVLLDVNLASDIDGIMTLGVLKKTPELASIPVLMLTGDATSTTAQAALTGGAVGYIRKDALGSLDLPQRIRMAARLI